MATTGYLLNVSRKNVLMKDGVAYFKYAKCIIPELTPIEKRKIKEDVGYKSPLLFIAPKDGEKEVFNEIVGNPNNLYYEGLLLHKISNSIKVYSSLHNGNVRFIRNMESPNKFLIEYISQNIVKDITTPVKLCDYPLYALHSVNSKRKVKIYTNRYYYNDKYVYAISKNEIVCIPHWNIDINSKSEDYDTFYYTFKPTLR